MQTTKPTNSSDHPDVMISSTYIDLVQHRSAVIDALLRLSLFPKSMEFDSAKADKTLIDSSLEMLANCQAYIGIVSHRYGSVPKDKERNPSGLSLTELEYRQALKLHIPVYMFLMSDEHLVRAADVDEPIASKKNLLRHIENIEWTLPDGSHGEVRRQPPSTIVGDSSARRVTVTDGSKAETWRQTRNSWSFSRPR